MRPWRIATVVYGIALTAGTHWPNLSFGEEMPASDKTTHLLAFAGLTVLLFRSGWFRSPWSAAAAAAAWSVVDELTQAMPGLNRQVGLPDMVANGLGCLLAGAWLAALGPVGGPPSRWRHAMLRATLDRVMQRWIPWLLAVALMLLTGGTYVAMRRVDPPRPDILEIGQTQFERGIVLLVAVIAVHVGVLAVMRRWQGSIDRSRSHGLCVACGRDRPELVEVRSDAAADAADAAAARAPRARDPEDANAAGVSLVPRPCPDCGGVAWSVAWLQSSPLRTAAMMRAALPPALLVAGLFAVGTAVVFLVPYGFRAAVGTRMEPTADALRRMLMAVPDALGTSIDVTLVGVVLAVGTHWTRRRMAAAFDRPRACRSCGHDLRGASTHQGVGRCGECGEVFLRVEDEADRPRRDTPPPPGPPASPPPSSPPSPPPSSPASSHSGPTSGPEPRSGPTSSDGAAA